MLALSAIVVNCIMIRHNQGTPRVGHIQKQIDDKMQKSSQQISELSDWQKTSSTIFLKHSVASRNRERKPRVVLRILFRFRKLKITERHRDKLFK